MIFLNLLAYQVAVGIADMHDVEDDGYASIAHSEYIIGSFYFHSLCQC